MNPFSYWLSQLFSATFQFYSYQCMNHMVPGPLLRGNAQSPGSQPVARDFKVPIPPIGGGPSFAQF